MTNISYLLRQGWASLRKDTGFVASVLVTMGVTIGVFLLVATISYFLLLRPLPYQAQERLYSLQYERIDEKGEMQTDAFLYPAAEQLYKDLQNKEDMLDKHGLIYFADETISSEPSQPRMQTAYVTPAIGEILSVRMFKGAWFTQDHELGRKKQQFEGAEDILARKVTINGVVHPIMGVLPSDFMAPQLAGTGVPAALWLPWDFNNSEFKESWNVVDRAAFLLARVNGEAAPLALLASSLTDDLFKKEVMDNPNFKGWHSRVKAVTLRDAITGRSMGALMLMAFGAAGLLLISTANIINLFLSRTVSKQKQLAISAALGARKRHLWHAVFAETMILMMMAAAAGMLLALAGFAFIRSYFSDNLARADELGLTPFTILCALAIGVTLALIIAAFAMRVVDYRNLSTSLRGSGKGTGVQISSGVRKGLIVSQVSIAAVLVFFSASLIRESAMRVSRPVGFDSSNVARIEFGISTLDFLGWNAYVPKVKELGERLRALPGVETVSFARSPIEDIHQFALTYHDTGERYYPYHRAVDHHYFDVVGQKLLAGNAFQEKDVQSRTNVSIVNEAFARQLSSNVASVIGKKLSIESIPPTTIIGVIQDIQIPSKQITPPRFYVPNKGTSLWLLVKLKPNVVLTREQVVQVMSETDKQFIVTKYSMLDDDIAKAKFSHMATLLTSVVLGLFTVFLACIGLFGIMNYSAQSRAMEFSIKLAIGAKYRHILREAVGENVLVLGLGLALGTAVIAAIGVYFKEALGAYISWGLLPLYVLALLMISSVVILSSVMPLRRYRDAPIIHGLRGIK